MSKVSLLVEFDSEQAAMAFLASRAGGAPAPAMAPPPPPPAPALAPVAYAPAPAPAPAMAPPPPAPAPAPAPAGGQLPPGVQFWQVSEDGQPWTPTKLVPLMQAYVGVHQASGLVAVFNRYGMPQNVTQLNAQQLAMLASHLKSNQPA